MRLPNVSAEHAGRPMHEGKIGVIDIGSNSIRLVVYDGLKRAFQPLFNEKVFCGLGRGLAITGKLNPEAVESAKASLPRLLAMARVMDVTELDIFATAAVRDAKDGPAFVEHLEKKHSIPIQVISGKKEAKLGALGVLSSMNEPEGLTGDLGGGSMELCQLYKGAIMDQGTLPIGSLRLIDEGAGVREKIRRLVDKQLDTLDWLKRKHIKNFYAIGGSFRALGKLHMQRTDYPLRILHQYTVSADSILSLSKFITSMSERDLAEVPGVSSKRAAALLPASLIIERLIKALKIDQVIFSAHGIREGYLFERLSPHLRNDDVLISACADMAAQQGFLSGYGRELFAWMEPLFPDEREDEARLRLAACMLSEIAWRVHPEYRAEWAFNAVLQSSLVGLTHVERIALASVLYHRYQFKPRNGSKELKILPERLKLWARVVGSAANLAYNISGGIPGNLPRTSLDLWKGRGELRLQPDVQDVMGDAVRKRAEGLGDVFRAFSSKSK